MLTCEAEFLLKGLHAECQKLNVPCISKRVGELLSMLILIGRPQSILEVGAAHGYSTIWLGEAAKKVNGRVISLEFSSPSFKAAQENVKKAHLEDIIDLCFGNALDLIPALDTQFDFVFFDSVKKEYPTLYDLIQPKLRENAILVFDNVKKFPEKTKLFWEKIMNQNDFDWISVPTSMEDEIVVMRRK